MDPRQTTNHRSCRADVGETRQAARAFRRPRCAHNSPSPAAPLASPGSLQIALSTPPPPTPSLPLVLAVLSSPRDLEDLAGDLGASADDVLGAYQTHSERADLAVHEQALAAAPSGLHGCAPRCARIACSCCRQAAGRVSFHLEHTTRDLTFSDHSVGPCGVARR